MWNILCDAIYERKEFFGLEDAALQGIEKVSTVRPLKKELPTDRMFYAIRNLADISVHPDDFGKFEKNGFTGIDAPDGEFYTRLGVDGYAYFSMIGYGSKKPVNLPAWKYTVSQWMYVAAKILNDTILYPKPEFFTACRMELVKFAEEDGENDKDYNGSYPGNVPSFKYNDDKATYSITFGTLADYRKNVGKGRSSDYRGCYYGAGTIRDPGYEYKLPELLGTVPLLYEGAVEYADYDGKSEILEEVSEVLQWDAAANTTGFLPFSSNTRNRINEIWDFQKNEPEQPSRAGVSLATGKISSPPMKLSAENFVDLPYKYWE